MPPKLLIIDETDFLGRFAICDLKFQMAECYEKFMVEVKSLYNIYYSQATEVKGESNIQEKDDMLHFLIIKFKKELVGNQEESGLLGTYKKKYSETMQKLEFYTFYIEMRKEILRKIDEFVDYLSKFMSYSLCDNQDPRNLIKECPNCHLIWFKTEGCDGETTCGRRQFSNYYDTNTSVTVWFKYFIEKVGKTLKIKKSPLEPIDIKGDWKQKVEEKNSKDLGVGCGKKIVWGELPKLDEMQIAQLFSVSSIDQVKELIKSNKLESERNKFAETVKTTFQE